MLSGDRMIEKEKGIRRENASGELLRANSEADSQLGSQGGRRNQ